jgi:DHA1 family bicyclomycin/chloramphenicol resistance-like MFS transporter
MTLAVLVAVPETLPPEPRHGSGLRTFSVAGQQVLGQRRYVGYLLVAGDRRWAPIRPRRHLSLRAAVGERLSPIAFSVDSAANAGGMTVAALVAARLAGPVATRNVILVGQVAALAAGVAMLIGAA